MHPTRDLSLAFVPPGVPSFADVIEALERDLFIPDVRRRDMISGVRRVAQVLNRHPKDVPCYTKWLQPRLADIAPAAFGMEAKTWQNAQSNMRSGLAHAGVIERKAAKIEDLSPAWKHLWTLVLTSGDKTLQPPLCRFVHFLNRREVEPEQVSEADARAYLDALVANETSKDPDRAYRAAVNGWNLAIKRISEWPQNRLPLASRQKVIRKDEAAFPSSFITHVDEVLHRLASPNPLDEESRTKALRSATVRQYRLWILRFASELVHSGIAATAITSLHDIIEPGMAERGLRQMLSRTGNQANTMIESIASLLRNLGTILQVPDKDLAKLKKLATKLTLHKPLGMTPKNRERLRVLQDAKQTQRLLRLPETILRNPPKGKANPFTQALAREDALAIAILLFCPVRIKNLAQIEMDRHLQRPGDGRAFLVLTENDQKNGRPLEFELPKDVVRMIDRHLATRSPELCPVGTPFLFPRRDGRGPVDANQLSVRLTRRIRREVGLEMNAHLFRHFAVMLWLDANPGAYEVARRLLGHSDVSHTIAMYSGMEVKAATRLFGELIEEKKGKSR